LRNRGADGGLIRDIGQGREVRRARRNGVIEGRAIAAKHRDRCSGARQRGRDLAADASPASGDERMRGTRQSGHARASPNEVINARLAYILDFKLLQEISSLSVQRGLSLLDRRSAAGSVVLTSRRTSIMATLEKGITRNGTGYSGKTWNILGQVYFPKAVTDSTFAFETNSDPGQFVPVHIHPTQDEFILVQDGMLDLKLDGVWVQAKAGDLVRLPRGISHGYFNKSDKPARALFWVSPTQKLEALFNQLHNLTDVAEIVRISAEHEVNFLPPEANE
jgi:quercetin dioxygenase-like cupin family protein